MKQTSSALTFLLAQYRAVFKRAYVKGLASAVLLTAALAAGSAQAADQNSKFTDSWDKPAPQVDLTNGDSVTLSNDIFATTVNMTGDVTVSGAAGRLVVKDKLSLTDGTLTLSTSTEGQGIFGFTTYPVPTEAGAGQPLFDNRDKVTTFTATNSSIEITGTKQGIIFNNVNLNNTDKVSTIASGSGIGADDGGVTTAGRGIMNISGGTYNLSDASYLYASQKLNIGAGTVINASGSGSDADSFSEIYAYDRGEMNFAGTLNVAANAGAEFYAGVMNLQQGAKVNNSGTLILGVSGDKTVVNIDGATITNEGKGYIWAQADVVMTSGTIHLKDGFGMAGTTKGEANALGTGVANFTASGGTITLEDADIAMLNVTLGGNVDVTLTGSSGDGVTWKNNSHIDAFLEGSEGGVFTVQDNAAIKMNDGSLLTAKEFNLNGGTITMQGTNDGNSEQDAVAMIRAFNTGTINLNGGAIDVTRNKAGILRGADINLTGSSITNNGTLTIAGKLSNAAESKVNTAESTVAFDMTGGTITNDGTLNLGVLNTNNAIGGTNSIFTFQGGTFTNAGTTNVASGATITTAGNFVLAGAGNLNLQSGAKAEFGGENVVLNGKLNIDNSATAEVTGKVTFNGNSDAAADISGGQLKLDTAGTLTINDAGTSLGLKYDTASKTFTSGYNNFSGAAGSTLYLDVAGLGLDDTIAADQVGDLVTNLKSALGTGDYLINLQGVKIGLSPEASADLSDDNTVGFDKVKDVLTSGVDSDQLKNAAITVTGSQEMQGSVGQVQTEANSTVNVAAQTLKLNGFAATPNGAVTSTVLTQAGTGSDATVAGINMQQGSTVTVDVDAALGTAYVGSITTQSGGSFAVAEGTNLKVVATTTKVNALTGETETTPTLGDIGTSNNSIYSLQATGQIEANDVFAQNTNVESNGALTLNSLTTDQAEIKGTVNVAEDITATTATGTGTFNVDATAQVKATNLEADQASLAGSTQFTKVNAQNAEYTGGTHNVSDTLAITSSLKVDGNAARSPAS